MSDIHSIFRAPFVISTLMCVDIVDFCYFRKQCGYTYYISFTVERHFTIFMHLSVPSRNCLNLLFCPRCTYSKAICISSLNDVRFLKTNKLPITDRRMLST